MCSSHLRLALCSVIFLLTHSTSAGERRFRELQNKATDWPALRFHFTLKRSSMKVFGESEFSMLANPIVSDGDRSVLYDVVGTFTQDTTVYNYTLVNGAAFISTKSHENTAESATVACLDSESGILPPINSIVSGINEAVGMSSGSDSRCTGSSFKILVNSIEFTLCAPASSGLKLYGDDMNIEVEFLDTQVNILQPEECTTECKSTISPISLTSMGKSLLSGEFVSPDDTRNLKAAFDFTFWSDDSQDSSHQTESRSEDHSDHHEGCSCKSTPRPCIFIHGMGVDNEEPENVESFLYYWGNLTDHAPCCSSMKFTVLNTVNNSWNDDTQQQKVCDRALAVSETSTSSVITDTILITHSMGNLMLAGGIATGKCSLDSSSTWVGLAGPMKGSMGSDFVQASCAGKTGGLLEQVADITGKCPPTTALVSLAYQGEKFASTKLNAAYTAAQEAYTANVAALMCSGGYSGLVSRYQSEFWVLGAVVPHKSSDNDGMVEFESCAVGIPASKFGDTWRSPFYKTNLNHYDSEFLYGDGLLSEAKMPVKWFECLL